MVSGKFRAFVMLGTLLMAFTLVSTDFADARRGGSFGSRGMRTFQKAPATRTAPNQAAPVERSMTPNAAPNTAARQQQSLGQRPGGLFGGMSGLMRGVLIGGLLGMLMGYGFGGMAGMLGFLLQLVLLVVVIGVVMRFLRARQTPATAGGPRLGGDREGGAAGMFGRDAAAREAHAETAAGLSAGSKQAGSFTIPGFGGAAAPQSQDIDLTPDDLDMFERMLGDVQAAFGDEDHAALRRLSTPEMVSFFSEELAGNAKNGLRNEVSRVHLLQADVAEAWHEDDGDYATAAFLYESIDVMRDRATGKVVEGDEAEPTETTELWTFVRRTGEAWKLSAIQEAV